MKKRYLSIFVSILLLTSCTNGNSSVSESTDLSLSVSGTDLVSSSESSEASPFQDIPLKEYTEAELTQMKLNSSSTVLDNSMNMKSDHPGRILWVEETGTLFYVRGDNTYQQNDSGTIAIADFPMLSMSLYNGKLYFVYPIYRDIKYDPTKRWGVLCVMDMSNGEITQVLEEDNIVNAYVVDGKLYYTLMEELKTADEPSVMLPWTAYEMDISTGEKELIAERSPFAVSEKYRIYTDYLSEGDNYKIFITITNKETGETVTYTEDKWLDVFSVYGDKLYYVYGARLRVLDLSDLNNITAETYELYDPISGNQSYIWTYTVMNGQLIVSTGSNICIWNGESFDRHTAYSLEMNQLVKLFGDIYNDGRQIYVLNGGITWYTVGTSGMNDLILPSGDVVNETLTLTVLKGE